MTHFLGVSASLFVGSIETGDRERYETKAWMGIYLLHQRREMSVCLNFTTKFVLNLLRFDIDYVKTANEFTFHFIFHVRIE
jgi:hypothetical protein